MEASLAAQYVLLLGVDTLSEHVLFKAIADTLANGLPPGWSQQVDDKKICIIMFLIKTFCMHNINFIKKRLRINNCFMHKNVFMQNNA